jgi:purine-binding chemotaxis protein CheW
VYLDALLCEATFSVAEEDEFKSQQPVDTAVPIATIESDQDLDAALESPEVTATEKPFVDKPDVEESAIVYPQWAQSQFQCLSFQVAGVTLAAPLEMLDGIVELTEAITELPGYSPWVMGLLPNRGKNVQVVDIAKIIMPEDRRTDIQPANERVKYLVLIDDGKFGLAADSISQVLTLQPSDVRWSRQNTRRPWLAGTVVDQMCALLEMEQLCLQLQSGLNGMD